MRQTEYNAYCSPRPTVAKARQKNARTALANFQSALKRTKEPKHARHVRYQVRDELLRHSVEVKSAIDAASDETMYDLAALLDLVVLTAFSAGHEDNGDAYGLQLLQSAVAMLQKSLSDDDLQDSLGRERAVLVEQIWAWLSNRDDSPNRL